jgi:hypothetical protein
MNWQNHTANLYLYCAQPLVISVVATIFWRRKLNKQFPSFFIFLLAQLAIFSIVFPLYLKISSLYSYYFFSFWTFQAVNAVLGFKVIHEIFIDVFRPYHTLKDLGTLLFKWAGVVMLLVSVIVAFSNSYDRYPMVHAVTTVLRSVRVVQLGLILFMLLFSGFLGVSKRQISFGISLGFGLFAGVELLLLALNSGGFINRDEVNLLNMGVYNLAIFIWLGYSLSANAVREVASNHLQTQRWEQGLADLQNPAPSDSLIPMFEGMVERAFSRSSSLEAGEDPFPAKSNSDSNRANSATAGSKNRP